MKIENEDELEAAFRNKLQSLLAMVQRKSSLSRADAEELAILADAGTGVFPERCIRLLRLAADDFPRSIDGQEELLQRCLRMLDAEKVVAPIRAMLKGGSGDQSAEDVLIPKFELQKGDKLRVFELCNQMRLIVLAAREFDEPHRLRLLNRIAAIESETHKAKGMFDVVRGGIDDLGETLGKFGTSIKPLTDRMKEVVSITRKGTRQYDQLPAPEEIKSLPAPDASGE